MNCSLIDFMSVVQRPTKHPNLETNKNVIFLPQYLPAMLLITSTMNATLMHGINVIVMLTLFLPS